MNTKHTRRGFTQINEAGQALADNAPTKGYKSAFTLIELLVVVLIIGILAAVALPQYQKAVDKARIAEALSLLKTIISAEKIYYLSNGEYTDDFGDLDMDIGTSDEEANANLKYIQSTANWHIKLKEISGNSIYAKSRFNNGELFIYYYLDKDTFHCCFNPNNTRAQQLCSSFGSTTTNACATDENLSCHPMNL